MPYLADTNILLRLLEPGTPMCEANLAPILLHTLRSLQGAVIF